MKFPTNPDFYRKLVLATILTIVAVYFQLTAGAVPEAIITTLVATVMYFLGVGTSAHPSDSPDSKE